MMPNGYDTSFKTQFDEMDCCFDTEFSQSVTVYQAAQYTGAYTVTPSVEGETLKTKNLIMTDDVTVNAIPYYQVENPSSGDTVYIGSEVIL